MTIIDELDIGIIAALVGVTSSLTFTWTKEKREKTKEVNKIRTLLQDDFTNLYREIVQDLQFFQNELGKLGTKDDLPSKLIAGSMDVPEVYSTYGIFYEFEYRQAIISSGSLLKLEKDEIRHVQAAYNSIDWYNKELSEAHKETMDRLIECLNHDDDSTLQYTC